MENSRREYGGFVKFLYRVEFVYSVRRSKSNACEIACCQGVEVGARIRLGTSHRILDSSRCESALFHPAKQTMILDVEIVASCLKNR